MDDHPAPGFTIDDARGDTTPLVFASPHSGRDYPYGFIAATRLTLAQLRRAEDAFVDTLLAGAVALGAPLIAARYGRGWLDLNRSPDELDPAMFVEPLDDHPAQAGERVAAGLGVVPRVAAHGLDIYPGRLRIAEARARIDAVHAPYHAALGSLLARARARHGFAILLDCHSMPTPASAGPPPEIVLGDLHGTASAPALTALVEMHFRGYGWRVARNVPYAGGFTTAHHAQPAAGVHVVQVEIERALYMDPPRLARHAGFDRVAAALTGLAALLVHRAPTLGLSAPLRDAAE